MILNAAYVLPFLMTLGLGGAVSGLFYYLVGLIKEYLTRTYLTQVEIYSMDPIHKWLL